MLKLTPFDPVKYMKLSDIPFFAGSAFYSLLHGRFRYAGRLMVYCWRVLKRDVL